MHINMCTRIHLRTKILIYWYIARILIYGDIARINGYFNICIYVLAHTNACVLMYTYINI